MTDAKKQFATRLKRAMEAAGLEAKPAVLEREFNLRYLGAPMTLHGVRRWLLGEVMPTGDKLEVLASWLDPALTPPPPAAGHFVGQPRKDWRAELPAVERETVDAYLALPLQQRKIVREVILAFAKQ